jgi:hypothetical protein
VSRVACAVAYADHRNFCCSSDPPVVISIESKTDKIDGSLYLYRYAFPH